MRVKCVTGNVSVEFEAETVKDVFKDLSVFQEVFSENTCGKCGSGNLRYVVRENEGNEYFELKCKGCHAKLAFGVNKKGGGLFPKRKDIDGNWLPDNGWMKWNQEKKALE